MNSSCCESQIVPERTILAPAHEIRTGRLVLKSPVNVGIKRLASLANNRAIAENLGTLPHPYTEQDATSWLAAGSKADKDEKRFSIHLDIPDEIFIGIISYRPVKEGGPFELGYWIGEPYWNYGYTSEAARAVVDFAFEEDGVGILEAGARITNVASRRVLEKCGFEYLGFAKCYSLALDEEVPCDRFALTRPRYMGLKWRQSTHD